MEHIQSDIDPQKTELLFMVIGGSGRLIQSYQNLEHITGKFQFDIARDLKSVNGFLYLSFISKRVTFSFLTTMLEQFQGPFAKKAFGYFLMNPKETFNEAV